MSASDTGAADGLEAGEALGAVEAGAGGEAAPGAAVAGTADGDDACGVPVHAATMTASRREAPSAE
jgi:hypothetical protein